MASMMQQLTNDVTENVISQITRKLLPAISDRYEIPIEDLLDLVNTKGAKKTTIKARPKTTPVMKKASNNSAAGLQDKITAAQDQDKVLNVSSGRPLKDTPPNRKKYKFFDELGIAGLESDEKLTEALKLLGAPSKKEVPVHRQAAKAKARAAKMVKPEPDDDDDDDVEEDESESVTEIPAPKFTIKKAKAKTVAKPRIKQPAEKTKVRVKQPEPDEDEEGEDDDNVEDDDEEDVEDDDEEDVEDDDEEDVEDDDGEDVDDVDDDDDVEDEEDDEEDEEDVEDDDDDEEEVVVVKAKATKKRPEPVKAKTVAKKAPVKRPAPVKAKTVAKKAPVKRPEPVKAKTVAKKAPVKRPEPVKAKTVTKKAPVKQRDNNVVKLSDIIEEKKDVKPLVKGKQPQARYNSKIKEWWNPQTKFVLKRKGIKSFVIGKVKADEVVQLSKADLQRCKSLGWVTDTTALQNQEVEESEESTGTEDD